MLVKVEEVKYEFAKAQPPNPFTVRELINGKVLNPSKDGHSIMFPLSEFKYDENSLPLPFSNKLRISVNHASRHNAGSKPRRLKNVHVLLHYAGMSEEEAEDAARAEDEARARGDSDGDGGGTAPRAGAKPRAAAPASKRGGLKLARGCGPPESFVAIVCLQEAEQLRRTLMLDVKETRILRSKISLCTVSGTWLVRSEAIPRANDSGGSGWQLKPSVRSDDGGGAIDHEYDLFMGAQGAKFFNGQSFFRHDELPALLDCFDVDAVVPRDAFEVRQKHAEGGSPEAGHAMASAKFGAALQAYATVHAAGVRLAAASPRGLARSASASSPRAFAAASPRTALPRAASPRAASPRAASPRAAAAGNGGGIGGGGGDTGGGDGGGGDGGGGDGGGGDGGGVVGVSPAEAARAKADVRKQLRRWFFEEAIFARRRENREFQFDAVVGSYS